MQTGLDRFEDDIRKEIDLDAIYVPYKMQHRYHASPAPYRCLGGAAGPGKTLAIIMDHMKTTARFTDPIQAEQVHTLMLRRTNPKLEATLITRFLEKVPRELYRNFKQSPPKTVTWMNGSTSVFDSMQHEKDAMSKQGQWLKIDYDEMAEFTFKQWVATSAWNRCPVFPYSTKGGATNPVGVGSSWIRALFVDQKPYSEMDEEQAKLYRPEDYAYFPCTYLDNPVYANDPTYVRNLMSYPEAIRNALMYGSWDVVGGYFHGAYDPAENVFPREEGLNLVKPWHRRFISGDWGFEHEAAIYWHYIDDYNVIKTYRERLVTHHDPEQLAEMIVENSHDPDGKMPKFEAFPFSHDAFASAATRTMGADPTPVSSRMAITLRKAGLPEPSNSGKNKLGREQGMYNMLRKPVQCGWDQETGEAIVKRAWMLSEDCPRLMAELTRAPRDEDRVELIAEYLGDDPLQGAGYGIQWITGSPGKPSEEQRKQEQINNTKSEELKHVLRLKNTLERSAKRQDRGYWE